MRKHEKGFSFLELLMVMVIMGFVLAVGSDMVVGLLRGYKQQSKISETNIEGIISLELLRRDIESAGYGLPWVIPPGTTYQEATNATAALYNDSTANPPRALLSGFDASNRAYLVVKAVNLASNDLGGNDACTQWTTLLTSGGTATTTTWDPSTENLLNTDRVIVISPGSVSGDSRTLAGPSGNTISLLQMSGVSGFADPNETRIVYGVASADGANALRMPFNRADYYVSTTAARPGRCATGTGVLVKSIVSQAGGGFTTTVPLLDCVADMQVVTYLDTNVDGSWDTKSNGLAVAASATAAQTIRDQLKEVHVFILAQEGQADTSYTNTTNPILVGESGVLGRPFDLTTLGDPKWQNYRWKVYTLVMRPNNLR